MALKSFQYQTQGTCCALMNIVLDDDKIYDVEFIGGCNGNLKGIRSLIKGMTVDEVIEKLKGITCGSKPTSCPDQLTQGLMLYKKHTEGQTVN